MKVLYFDAFAGISGDMTVGALLALGFPLDQLRQALSQLPLTGYTVRAAPRSVHGIAATKFEVQVAAGGHGHRAFRDIREMLERSPLEPIAKQHALSMFTKLAAAEARIHGVAADDVTFHEIGAVDSIVDIVGAAVGIAWVGAERVHVSALPLGTGVVASQHGPLPVPAPATVELLRGFVTRAGDGEGELVTPTGAAIVASVARSDPAPDLRIAAAGYGAGQRTLRDRPNLLRLVVGESVDPAGADDLVVIETNIDDLNPEFYDHVMDRLFAAGARDVYFAPIHMKKNRPGIVLSVLCAEEARGQLSSIMLSETSALGVRYHTVRRVILPRAVSEVMTPYGAVHVKRAVDGAGHENLAPEYEDCKRLARERQVPIKIVYQAAIAAARSSAGDQ